MECSLCGRLFTSSISLGQHISRQHISTEHNEGVCLVDVDFPFDPDVICGLVNALEEEFCDLEHLARKRPRTNESLEEDSSFDEAPWTDIRTSYHETEMEYGSINDDDEEDYDEDDIDIDININDNNGEADIDIDNNMNHGEDAVEEIIGNEPAFIGPDMLEN